MLALRVGDRAPPRAIALGSLFHSVCSSPLQHKGVPAALLLNYTSTQEVPCNGLIRF